MLRAAALALVALVAASAAGARPEATAKPLPGLPRYTAGYTAWTKLNRRPIPPSTADAHPGTKNVFASRKARRGRYPVGTVIVKEVRRPGRRFVYLVAAMRKLKGVRAHNGWQMVEWKRETARSRFTVLASGGICTSCHMQARANDYVFTRR